MSLDTTVRLEPQRQSRYSFTTPEVLSTRLQDFSGFVIARKPKNKGKAQTRGCPEMVRCHPFYARKLEMMNGTGLRDIGNAIVHLDGNASLWQA